MLSCTQNYAQRIPSVSAVWACGLLWLALLSTGVQASQCDSPVQVRSGDTLSEIAQRCGTTVAALLVNNPHIDESGAVKVGERIHLPPVSSQFSAKELDTLLAPIALYPDVLLAEILPASSYPLEVVQAARWQEQHPHTEVGDDQAWPDSVKALTRYPDVLAQMDEDIDWTQQLGDAFLSQPDDVFKSIQRLRRQADANGNLKDNEVQDIVYEDSTTRRNETIIRIVHADPYYVHVPRYDPYLVYSPGHSHYTGLHFGAGLLLGGWLHHTLDWHHRHLFYQPYHATAYQRYYRYRHYRPYTSFAYNRSYNKRHRYDRPHYDGRRWRHDRRYSDRYARRHNNNGHYNGNYRNGHYRNTSRHHLQRYSLNRRPVDRPRYRATEYRSLISGQASYREDANRRDRRANQNRSHDGARDNRRAPPDKNLRAWKDRRTPSAAPQGLRNLQAQSNRSSSNRYRSDTYATSRQAGNRSVARLQPSSRQTAARSRSAQTQNRSTVQRSRPVAQRSRPVVQQRSASRASSRASAGGNRAQASRSRSGSSGSNSHGRRLQRH